MLCPAIPLLPLALVLCTALVEHSSCTAAVPAIFAYKVSQFVGNYPAHFLMQGGAVAKGRLRTELKVGVPMGLRTELKVKLRTGLKVGAPKGASNGIESGSLCWQ